MHTQRRLPGDLIVFAYGKQHPNHIGIVLDGDRYVHSPGRPETQVEAQDIVDGPIPHVPEDSGQYVCNPIGYKALVRATTRPTYRFPMRVIGSGG